MTTRALSDPRAMPGVVADDGHHCEYREALWAVVYGPEPPAVSFNEAAELLTGRRWDDETDIAGTEEP